MNPARRRVREGFGRRTAKALLWTSVLLAAAIAANLIGIYRLGSIEGWARWLAGASWYFLLWRLCLYAVTAAGWRWMRRRLLAREPDGASRRRLVRAEIAGVLAIAALECSLLLQVG
uniref:hypothetical protein n=1 Tax=Marinobacterium profundum TaxID=1714300 RepID=UPI0008352605|nr:hypothetical protein [Marinobacterium profundum]